MPDGDTHANSLTIQLYPNRIMPTLSRPAKSHYTEGEVAEELGVSVERLRSLIREQVMLNDEEVRQASGVFFQPSDLLLLRLLAAQAVAPRD